MAREAFSGTLGVPSLWGTMLPAFLISVSQPAANSCAVTTEEEISLSINLALNALFHKGKRLK